MFLIEPGSELTTSCIGVLILGFSFYSVWVKNDKKHTHTHNTIIIIVLHYLSSIKCILILIPFIKVHCVIPLINVQINVIRSSNNNDNCT